MIRYDGFLLSENWDAFGYAARRKNIRDILETLSLDYHQKRQGRIDEELFDIVSGFTALKR
nr:hypothetical protein [Prosthecochloris sp.]